MAKYVDFHFISPCPNEPRLKKSVATIDKKRMTKRNLTQASLTIEARLCAVILMIIESFRFG